MPSASTRSCGALTTLTLQVENGASIENDTQQEGKRGSQRLRPVVICCRTGQKRHWQPPEVDLRLTWALSTKMDEFVTSILAEQRLLWI